MPVEKARIRIYDISKCGYYAWKGTDPEFGEVGEIMADLSLWSKGKLLAQTKTYESADFTELFPVYLLDIKEKNGNWLIKIWNETPASEGNVHSVMGASSVGNPKVVANKIVKGSIPGFATYFWVVPKRNIFASVGFQHLITGQPAFQQYMKSYIELFSKFVVHAQTPADDADIDVLGYRESSKDQTRKLYPRFQTEMFTKPGDYGFLKENFDKITRAVRKTKLQLNRQDDLKMWQQFLRWTQISVPSHKPADFINLQYVMSANITKDDLAAIIDEYQNNSDRQWDDYGFKVKGDQSTHWLSHSSARGEFDLDVVKDNDEVFNTDSLLAALDKRKAAILKMMI